MKVTRYPPDIEKAVMASNRNKLLAMLQAMQALISRENINLGRTPK